MREATTRGVICLEDPETGVEYHLARIEYREREDETFSYVIEPNYSVISLLSPPLFQGIPGLNLDLKRKRYVRENRTPVFISERTPAENREDVRKLLDDAGMDYLNPLEWLMRTDTRYGGDSLFVRRPTEGVDDAAVDVSSTEGGMRETAELLLRAVASGRTVRGDGFSIDDANRGVVHALLRALCLKGKKRKSEPRPSSEEKRGRGRRRKPVDEIRYEYAVVQFEKGLMTAEEAARKAGVSRATFFRRLKEAQ